MAYVMAVVYKLESDEPIEILEKFIETLPQNALYFTNPLVMPDSELNEVNQFDAVVYYYDPNTGRREEARSILEIVEKSWVYSTEFIAQHLGLTEEQVLEVLEASR
jgi:predicted adenine nucleotide alpha hydrolase (AANH) superfamily ATPase